MAQRREPPTEPRLPLSRERVLRAAVTLADEHGVESLTMRRLADELGAEAMSLYYHVTNKDDVLGGLVDIVVEQINDVVGQIELPPAGAGWKKAVRQRILSAREVLLRHKWVPALIESRGGVSAPILRYLDGLLGLMRDGGFSYDQAHHALHALGSRALGFSQELFTPGDSAGAEQDAATFQSMADQLPHLVGMITEIAHDDPDSTLGWCDDQAEFEFGLDLLLDGLDRIREQGRTRRPTLRGPVGRP